MKKLLVFITTLLTIFALSIASILPANAQTTVQTTTHHTVQTPKHHVKKQPLKNKPYPKTLSVPKAVNTITFDNQSLPIGDFTLPNIYSDLSASQAAIDAGQIVQGYNTIDVTDGKSTYLAGHNPGVMTPLEAYAQIGKVITIHDRNGEARDYRFTNMIPTSTYGHAMSPEAISYMNTHMSDHEGLVIQWCRNDLNQMQLWILDPVD